MMANLVRFYHWICIMTLFHTGVSSCPSNSSVYTENGQTKILKFEAPIKQEIDFVIYRVARYDGITLLAVNYQHGKVIGEPTLQNCSLAASANIQNGLLHIELNPVVDGDQGTYKLTELSETTTVIQCMTLYIQESTSGADSLNSADMSLRFAVAAVIIRYLSRDTTEP
ncbi:uncharacterized protein LOC128233844 [Mya arenaria]|uniref:uncharacterized protein LOC128233844 n=1 Tax=Mya arenaria TaxID=6604 RepID=UPI0022E778E2|nr:uncharacterized protein LOC128233844 [Mya arenaria]